MWEFLLFGYFCGVFLSVILTAHYTFENNPSVPTKTLTKVILTAALLWPVWLVISAYQSGRFFLRRFHE